jgi:heme exporter protein D
LYNPIEVFNLKQCAVLISIQNKENYLNEFLEVGFQGIMQQRLLATPVGLAFPKNHYLIHLSNEVVQSLVSGGIIEQIEKQRHSVCFGSDPPDEWKPFVFSLNDLLFGFYIWLVAVAVSLVVMTLEWTWFIGKRTTIRVAQNVVGIFIILQRLQRGFGL